jgi:hypothetical protein
MILTSNRGFAERGDVFGDPVLATALLDRLLHHAVVVQIEGASSRLRSHADLIPEHVRANAPIAPPPPPKRRGGSEGQKRSRQSLIPADYRTRRSGEIHRGTSEESSGGIDSVEAIPRGRRCVAAPGSFVSDVGPEPRGPGPAGARR